MLVEGWSEGKNSSARAHTCPAVGVVAETVEEYHCRREGRGVGSRDGYGWFVGHGMERWLL